MQHGVQQTTVRVSETQQLQEVVGGFDSRLFQITKPPFFGACIPIAAVF